MSVARPMNGTARIRVASGPDRGGVFELGEAMVNIGRDPQSEIALTDADVPDYQLSVVRKNDRFVIFAPLENSVQVDGQWIPAEKWMWLPASARIRLSPQTTLQFESDAPAAAPPAAKGEASPQAEPQPGRPVARFKGPPQSTGGTGKDRARRKQEGKRDDSTVARFITDRGNETLVQLGADGHLPELSLQEETRTKTKEKRASGSSSVWAYAALAASFVMSIGLLLVDFGPGRSSRAELAEAQAGIVEFYGDAAGPLEPYQESLRQARRARSRGDRQAELNAYSRVLAYLDDENLSPYTGLTGEPENDERLRRYIGILMSE